MLKIASILVGESPARTAAFQPSSQRKIKLLASCLLLPVLLWFINAYLLVSHVLRGSAVAALLTATTAALVVFLIERAVIMAKGHGAITAFRLLLGVVVALLGSVSMDEVVFQADIDNQMASYRETSVRQASAAVDSSFQPRLREQQALAAGKYQAWQQALAQASGEADGTTGSGVAKVGHIAQLKLRVAALYAHEYQVEQTKLTALQRDRSAEQRDASARARKAFKGEALLLRLKAMYALIRQDSFMLGIYLLYCFPILSGIYRCNYQVLQPALY